MSLHSDVEALARALGVWWLGETWEVLARAGKAWVIRRHDSGFEVVHYAGLGQAVDPTTAAVILLGHARGLRVDIGECPACPPVEPPADAPTPMMDTPAKRGEQRKYTRSRPRGKGWRDSRQWGAFEFAVPYWWRLCPDCEATGRQLLAWERAIIDAMPREDASAPRVHEHARACGVEPMSMRAAVGAKSVMSRVKPGDPATRTALTILAHRLADPMHVAVFGDWCESGHEPAAFPGVPRSGFAALLAWWLAGPDVLGQHECKLRSIVLAARLTFEMSNFSPASDTLGQSAPGV